MRELLTTCFVRCKVADLHTVTLVSILEKQKQYSYRCINYADHKTSTATHIKLSSSGMYTIHIIHVTFSKHVSISRSLNVRNGMIHALLQAGANAATDNSQHVQQVSHINTNSPSALMLSWRGHTGGGEMSGEKRLGAIVQL